jgi:uncharacterized protein (DUF433 family)
LSSKQPAGGGEPPVTLSDPKVAEPAPELGRLVGVAGIRAAGTVVAARKESSLVRPAPPCYGDRMNYLDRITYNPAQCGGRPCIRGMRIRVKDVLDLLAADVPEAEILEDYPDLEAGDIKACLQYAAAQADHAVLKVA